MRNMSINPFANRKHFLIKGVMESTDKKKGKKVEYVRLVRNFGYLALDRTNNKEEIDFEHHDYTNIFNALEEIKKISPECRIITNTYDWDLLLVELGWPCVGVCFSPEKKRQLGLL